MLSDVRAWCAERGLASFREWAEAWLGGALLVLRRPAGEARALLAPAVAGMRRARRHLELPAAAVFLAEAEWRLGEPDADDAAADAAYAAAEDCGTLHPLARALELMPDVLARRLDAEGARQRAPLAHAGACARPRRSPPSPTEHARLRVRTLGPPALEIDGEPVANVPLKAVELAAEIARAGPPGIARSQLVSSLFEGSRDGPNYLRQLVFRLRRALPRRARAALVGHEAGLAPGRGGRLRRRAAGVVARAAAGGGRPGARPRPSSGRSSSWTGASTWRASTTTASSSAAGGSPGSRRTCASTTPARCASRATPGRALAVLTAAIDADPYREDAWQELMRVQAGLAGPAAVGRVFIECRRSLSEVGLEPSGETRVMLERLRG